MKKLVGTLMIAVLSAGAAAAQSSPMAGMDHSKMDMAEMMRPTSSNPFPPAEMDMHKKMMSAVGNDATETWVRKMIEHHRGAIAMSRIVLRDTRDANVRSMATKSEAEQTREIGELQAWLKTHGKRAQ